MFTDLTCMEEADKLSCKSMTELAKKEYDQNYGMIHYTLGDITTCERYHTLADREKEYMLQKPTQFARNMCIEKTVTYNQGVWDKQFRELTKEHEEFDAWTRRKINTQLKPTGATEFGSASASYCPQSLFSNSSMMNAKLIE